MRLFGNLFDFDGDGEEDLMETMLGIGLVSALFDDPKDKKKDESQSGEDDDEDDWRLW